MPTIRRLTRARDGGLQTEVLELVDGVECVTRRAAGNLPVDQCPKLDTPEETGCQQRPVQSGNAGRIVPCKEPQGPAGKPPELVRSTDIAVVVTTHAAYTKFLPDCLASIDQQTHPATQKILICDGCDESWAATQGWLVLAGDWHSPQPGRNLGLSEVKTQWVVFFDADNRMSPDQLAQYAARIQTTDRRDACLYPDIQYTWTDGSLGRLRVMGEPDFWRLHRQNYVDTSACWRTAALRSVGGWDEQAPNCDDFALAAALLRQGWQLVHVPGALTLMREHDEGRRSLPLWKFPGQYAAAKWRVKRHCVVTLFAGRRETFEQYLNWLREAGLPPHCDFLAVDNSRDPAFAHELWSRLPLERFGQVTISQRPESPSSSDRLEVLRHIATLYNDALSELRYDAVLVVEDDVIPPLDAARRLYDAWGSYETMIGAVGGVYECPDAHLSGRACLSQSPTGWSNPPLLSDVLPELQDVMYLGAGCTWYAGWALAAALPCPVDPGRHLGWDAVVSEEIRRAGYRLAVDGSVRCDHLFRLREKAQPATVSPDRLQRIAETLTAAREHTAPLTHDYRRSSRVRRVLAAEVPGFLGEVDVQLLFNLSRLAPGGLALETGRWCGRSTAVLWACGKRVWSIDSNQPPTALKANQHSAKLDAWCPGWRSLDDCWHVTQEVLRIPDDQVTEVCGDSRDDSTWPPEPDFGLAFLDGGHNLETVVSDLRHAWSLLAPGGILACHDYDLALLEDTPNHPCQVDLGVAAWLAEFDEPPTMFAAPDSSLVWFVKVT